MSTTIDVICYKSKVLKNNENPLMLRVARKTGKMPTFANKNSIRCQKSVL
ncbi:hypothetical protein FACS189416_1770 [Bacteroidia bacterium]|nr:hypothetical protein FACS189416_1770 [Bacteroidia bacterium]